MASFYGEELLVPPQPPSWRTPHPLSADNDCLLNIFTATHNIGGNSSICNLRTCHAMVTGTYGSERSLVSYHCFEYAYTEEKSDASKDSSYEELEQVFNNFPQFHIKFCQEMLMQTGDRGYFQTDNGMRVNMRTVMMLVLE